jgi:dihydrofolate reductase
MRKLIVSNMASLDGFYEGENRDLGALFRHMHPDYAGDDLFDHYNLERLLYADTLILSGRASFMGFRDYWHGREMDAQATEVRRAIGRRMDEIEKAVISDKIAPEERAPWGETEIVRLRDANAWLAEKKAASGRDILVLAGRIMWNSFLKAGLVDEIHLAIFPLIGGAGTKLFDEVPDASLRLIEVRSRQGSGVVLLSYSVER